MALELATLLLQSKLQTLLCFYRSQTIAEEDQISKIWHWV